MAEPLRRLASLLAPYLSVLFPEDEDPNARRASRIRRFEGVVKTVSADQMPATFRIANLDDFLFQLTRELADRFGESPLAELARAARSLTGGPRAEELDQIADEIDRRSNRPGLDLKLEDLDWKGPRELDEGLEKVMGKQPTFLPVSFLELGLVRARSVVRIVTPEGIGTGFLTHGNLIVSNHHVIPTEDMARRSVIQFNYQNTVAGLPAVIEECPLHPEQGFATSTPDDWTAVRTVAGVNEGWGAIDLSGTLIHKDCYVNIVQHPAGSLKQIAIYHNVITYADRRRVQYLTDTMPGSSGSPVFDSQWRLVAVHHSGGWLAEPGSKRVFYRNEGIGVAAVLEGLVSCGLYSAPASTGA